MDLFERLESQSYDEGILIDRSRTLKDADGMLVTLEDYPPIIHLSPSLGQTEAACVLAEELGHYYTGAGDDGFCSGQQQTDRAEVRALRSAVRDVLRLHPDRIIDMIIDGACSFHELADKLEITEAFLVEIRSAWIAEYGLEYVRDGYHLTFTPLSLYIEPWARRKAEPVDEDIDREFDAYVARRRIHYQSSGELTSSTKRELLRFFQAADAQCERGDWY